MLSIITNQKFQSRLDGISTQKQNSKTLSTGSAAIPQTDDKYSDAITSYGKALISFGASEIQKEEKDTYTKFVERFLATTDTDTITLDDAVKELNGVEGLSPVRKINFIMDAAFEIDKPDLIINKKALMILKDAAINKDIPPRFEDAIKASLDESDFSFDSEKFHNMFNYNGKIKISANTRHRSHDFWRYRTFVAQRQSAAASAVYANQPDEVNDIAIKQKDLFTPLASIRQDLTADLDGLKESGEVSADLYNTIKTAIQQNNFNIKEVYNSHYALLNDCKTLEEVKALYPEIEFPDRPVHDNKKSVRTLQNRLAQEDFDKISLDIIKRFYLGFENKNCFVVELEKSPPPTWATLEKAGFHYSMPADNLKKFLEKCGNVLAKYDAISSMSEEQIEKSVNKHAIRNSKVWADYQEMTSGRWFPVRLIKYNRTHPDSSKYATPKLVDTYLHMLYDRNPDKTYSPNPLENFDKVNYLFPQMAGIINVVYRNKFKETQENKLPDSVEFTEFKKQFDTEAIGKSIEHLEKVYTGAFFSGYWNKDRVNALKAELQKSYSLAYEKLDLKTPQKTKQVTDEDVMKLVNEDLEQPLPPQVDEKEISKFKYLVSQIENNDLKTRCASVIQDGENVEKEYFDTINNILKKSQTTNGINENKALALLQLHDEYLNQIITSGTVESEDEFAENRLSSYKLNDNDYDYTKYLKDTKSEVLYKTVSSRLLENGDGDFYTMLENKFVSNNNPDYDNANRIISFYENIPEIFKGKFINEIKSTDKIKTEKFIANLEELYEKISSWNFDEDEIIVMDEDKIPQKVVITHNAKMQLLEMTGRDLRKFDNYLKKFYAAAHTRTGKTSGQGIKSIPGSGYDAEIKIMGEGGAIRMYTRPITDFDRNRYETGDGINLKYVFDTCNAHL